MANKGVIAVLVVAVVASLGVGIVIGLQLGGGGPTAGPANGTNGTTATPVDGATPTPGDGEATATPTGATPTADGPTATDEPATETATRTPIPSVRFDETLIAENVSRLINERRAANGKDRLSTSGNTVEQLNKLARNHSQGMATQGETVHISNGLKTRQRYQAFGLFTTCKIQDRDGNILEPDSGFEVIGKTYAGTPYESGGETQFNANERQVAQAMVEEWMSNSVYRPRILRFGYGRVGVGVDVLQDGSVYVTADFCA